MTHNQRVLELLSDGEPHSHLELYDLRVIAHSRVAALRKQGHTIDCWRSDGLHWYHLADGGLSGAARVATTPPVDSLATANASVPLSPPLIVEDSGQLAIAVAA